jgi:formylglycine-generating enzyme
MRRLLILVAGFGAVWGSASVQAMNMEMVTIGDAGNAADTRYETPGYGSVGYSYSIGTYEVTAGQYCEFLNAAARSDAYGLYSTEMWRNEFGCKIEQTGLSGDYRYSVASDLANRPVNFVSFWDAARFCNWMHNGQGNGDTETGSYSLNGYTGSDGRGITRNPGATWVIPTENEWYKAAFYKGGGLDAGYWNYPTAGDQMDTSMANYSGSVGHATDVGTYGAYPSPYGTFDQGGNVWEWNQTVVYEYDTWSERGRRGGGFGQDSHGDLHLHASNRSSGAPMTDSSGVGFRVAFVPEPTSLCLLLTGLVLALKRWNRSA